MASAKALPVVVNPLIACAAYEEDLENVLKGRHVTVEESGWTRLHSLGLLVPIKAKRPGSSAPDQFYLRLEFQYYPEWPPSAQFVNPATNVYSGGNDLYWLPKIEGTDEIRIHENYSGHGQLICSSITLEFYKVLHDVKEQHVWKHPRQNFASTINQIEWALSSSYYTGRFRESAA